MPEANASNYLRQVISKSSLSLREIARRAKVDRTALARWYRKRQDSIKLDDADRVMKSLTGKGFTQ